MPELEWLRPGWLALVPLGLVVAVLARGGGDAAASWRRVVDPALLPHLLVGRARGAPRGAAWLAAAALAAAGIALAGPSLPVTAEQGFRSAAARMLVLDVSRSMDAEDVVPTRLHRARRTVDEILGQPFDGLSGLVVFAGDAFTVTPLTDDVHTIRAMLPALDSAVVPVQGSRADRGLARAAELLARGGARGGQVLLITDGAPREAARVQAAVLAERGFEVSVLGVGTPRGAPVPLPGGALLTDARGAVVVPALDEAALAAIARAGGGVYVRLADDGSHLQRILPGLADGADGARAVARRGQRWQDQGYWLLPVLLVLGALAFRRGWLLSVVLGAALAPPPAAALDPAVLLLRADQRAAAALAAGDPAAALAADAGPAWSGAALYRAGDFEAAARAFAQQDGADGHYNRGNALARAGRLADALAAYDAALARDPTLPDARFNRALVERALRERRQRDGASAAAADGADAPHEQAADAGSERGETGSDGREGSDAEPGRRDAPSQATPDAGGAGEQERPVAARAARDPGPRRPDPGAGGDATPEETARIERWLEQVPDDPGGLLRRKFAKQYEGRRRGAAPGPQW